MAHKQAITTDELKRFVKTLNTWALLPDSFWLSEFIAKMGITQSQFTYRITLATTMVQGFQPERIRLIILGNRHAARIAQQNERFRKIIENTGKSQKTCVKSAKVSKIREKGRKCAQIRNNESKTKIDIEWL